MQQHDGFSDDPDRIAAELAQERAALAGRIDDMRGRLTTDALLEDAMQFARDRIGPVTHAIDTAVRANPVAAAMTVAGLAWLVFERKTGQAQPTDALAGTPFEAMSRWEDEGGPVAPLPEVDVDWCAEADALRGRAHAALADLEAAARAHHRTAAEVAHERVAILSDLAANTRRSMAHGLESLSTAARERIIAARERAYTAHSAVAHKSASLIEAHPLLAGAMALAAGALVARSLPVSETENRVLGPERDRLFAEAQRLLQAERARLVSLASAA
jgi:hypothetical protein